MKKRPLCLFFLFLAAGLSLLDILGLPLIHGNPLPEEVQAYIIAHPDSDIEGTVYRVTETETGVRLHLRSALLHVPTGQTAAVHSIQAWFEGSEPPGPGSRILLHGRLLPIPGPRGPGEFDSRQYCACQQIYYRLKNAVLLRILRPEGGIYSLLSQIKSCLQAVFQELAGEDAPIFEALLLGDRTHLDEELRIRYQIAGIIHILAVSGVQYLIFGFYRSARKPVNWALFGTRPHECIEKMRFT